MSLPPIELDEVADTHDCLQEDSFEKIGDAPATTTDWTGPSGSQGYFVCRCRVCRDVWGCRYQYDPGTGADDHWHRFGDVDPMTVKRHY